METVILVGGRGTRIAVRAVNKPKCLIEVGGRPIVTHIMDLYAAHGFRSFTLAAGYKHHMIRHYFRDNPSPYSVDIADTGPDTQTGGRLKQFEPDGTFMATYGDGVGNIDITALVAFHKSHGKRATVTAVRPPARFGALHLEGDQVTAFDEKPQTEGGWISGGFFVFEPEALDYIEGDDTKLEHEPLANLARDGQLMAFKHEGYWQPMDTMRERDLLEDLWQTGAAPWVKR